ncbi:hypothetical protein N3K66_008159 [Trichothecium roseum]|uniref:Uncharacterized protein n=1 Tax=Trichothecium roseum TaxID=47278 RepID=A0ACC0UV78_9HYPO|nr:hypothetical protein N3K66_008159 [Trichothecium roseum]
MSGSRGLQALGSMDDAKALAREFKGQGDGGGAKRKNKNKKSKATISTTPHGNSHPSSVYHGRNVPNNRGCSVQIPSQRRQAPSIAPTAQLNLSSGPSAIGKAQMDFLNRVDVAKTPATMAAALPPKPPSPAKVPSTLHPEAPSFSTADHIPNLKTSVEYYGTKTPQKETATRPEQVSDHPKSSPAVNFLSPQEEMLAPQVKAASSKARAPKTASLINSFFSVDHDIIPDTDKSSAKDEILIPIETTSSGAQSTIPATEAGKNSAPGAKPSGTYKIMQDMESLWFGGIVEDSSQSAALDSGFVNGSGGQPVSAKHHMPQPTTEKTDHGAATNQTVDNLMDMMSHLSTTSKSQRDQEPNGTIRSDQPEVPPTTPPAEISEPPVAIVKPRYKKPGLASSRWA